MEKYLYLGVLLFAISYPLAQSFEHRIRYASQWKYLFPGLVLTAALFIVWDIWFTNLGVWEFNTRYVLGVFYLDLPIEEWLFFLIVPFSSIFIYEVLIYFFPKDHFHPFAKASSGYSLHYCWSWLCYTLTRGIRRSTSLLAL